MGAERGGRAGRVAEVGGEVIWPILSALARLLGPILPFLATWVAAKRDSRQTGKIKGLQADMKALKDRERIEDDIADDTGLVDRAKRSGVLRRTGE